MSRPNAAPIVGITTCLKATPPYAYVRRAYSESVRRAGGYPILITPDVEPKAVHEMCEALIVSGGDDLPSTTSALDAYTLAGTGTASLESPERIRWERTLLDLFTASSKRVLGICYGMQLINLHFGGTLLPDLKAAGFTRLDHGSQDEPRAHQVTIAPHSHLFSALGADALVSSRHHQAIALVASGFLVSARAGDDVVEAIESSSTLGVEWHPEDDETGPAVYGWLCSRLE